jgi:hypothetical protein
VCPASRLCRSRVIPALKGVLVDTAAGLRLLPGIWSSCGKTGRGPGVPIPTATIQPLCYERSFRGVATVEATVLPSHDARMFDCSPIPSPLSFTQRCAAEP